MAVSMSLWAANPSQWYYGQEASGGMPLTHISYCYLNAIRWILGRPITVSACANPRVEATPGRVLEDTRGALFGIENGAFTSATASYNGPEGMGDVETRFVCTRRGVQVHAESPPGGRSA